MSGASGELRQEYVQIDLDALVRHPRNARQGDIGAITTSILRNGFWGTVVVQKSTSRVIVGWHRVQAAKHAGLVTIPAMIVDVDDAHAARIVLADNRSSDLASYDLPALTSWLKELAIEAGSVEAGLDGTLFDGDDLDGMLADLARDAKTEVEPLPDADGSVKALTLQFDVEQYERIQVVFRRIMQRERLTNPADVLVYVLSQHEGLLEVE